MKLRVLLVAGTLAIGLTGCSDGGDSKNCQQVVDPAFDTTDVKMLTERSQNIVVASVADSTGTVENPVDPRTLFPVTVIKALKGNPPGSFTVAQEGTEKCQVLGTGSKPLKAGDYLLFVDEKGVGVDWYHLWNSIHLNSADLTSVKSGTYTPDQTKLRKTMTIIANGTKPQAPK